MIVDANYSFPIYLDEYLLTHYEEIVQLTTDVESNDGAASTLSNSVHLGNAVDAAVRDHIFKLNLVNHMFIDSRYVCLW